MADNMSLYTAPDVFLESTSPMTLSDLSEDIGLRKAFCLKQTAADKLLSDVADVAQKAAAGDLVRKGTKKEVRYVVDIGEELKNAIDSGAVKLDCNKAGEVFAQIRDSSGHFGVKLPIKKELIAAGIDPTAVAQALQMKAIENKLNLMLDALDEIGQDVSAVIQGQQNDRIGLYNSGLNLYIESTNIQDQTLRTLVSAQAIKSLSDGTEQLLQEVQSHIHYLLENQHTKKKGHSIEDIYDKMNQINKCFGVIHKSYLLKASIYYAHNEIPAMLSVLDEYGRFLEREIAPNAQRLSEFDRSDTLLQNGKWEQRGQLLQSIGTAKRQLTEATVYLLGTECVNDDQGQAGQSLPQR